ncbi:MAG: apolipoprotein N-acyltransferase [Candidatus Polarisedimenticolaceae bacterium]|nr:apolipoprotein N-acyltransferase [Candidatus Polarisedimenticolaceae bacterium]
MQPVISTLRHHSGLVAFLAGASTTLAFAPISLFPLALFGPAVLFWLLLERPGFRTGFLYGLGLMGSGISWLYVSIEQFGELGTVIPILLTFAFVAFVAQLYGLFGWLCLQLGARQTSHNLLLIYPALWVLVEWLRSWVLTGFPWLSLGYSQIDSPLAGYAPLLGLFAVSWAATLCAGLLVTLLTPSTRIRAASLAGLILIGGLGGLLRHIEWSSSHGEPIKVALIQGNIPQKIKWNPEQLMPTLQLFSNLTMQHQDADLIIWPETAVPGLFYRLDAEFFQPLEQLLQESNSSLLFGVVLLDKKQQGYQNAMVGIGANRAIYTKQHLVPFTEYLPLKPLFGPIVEHFTIPMSNFTLHADWQPTIKLGGYTIGMSICYEDAFGSEMIRALPDAEFLVNTSNDAWFGDSLAPHQHLEIARMRALEAGRYLLRGTNTGISAIIGPQGEIVQRSPLLEEHVLRGEIEPMSGLTPYARIGDWGILLLLFGTLSTGLFFRSTGHLYLFWVRQIEIQNLQEQGAK